jgi:aminocarboxymuconate-semialdehyde decarboxylase
VGPDRIVMGSDYPVGDTDPVGFVTRCDALSPAEADMVLGGTAGQLLGFTANDDELGIATRG